MRFIKHSVRSLYQNSPFRYKQSMLPQKFAQRTHKHTMLPQNSHHGLTNTAHQLHHCWQVSCCPTVPKLSSLAALLHWKKRLGQLALKTLHTKTALLHITCVVWAWTRVNGLVQQNRKGGALISIRHNPPPLSPPRWWGHDRDLSLG